MTYSLISERKLVYCSFSLCPRID